MLVRYGIEDASVVSRLVLINDVDIYFSRAKLLNDSRLIGEEPMVLPKGKVLVMAGGRGSLVTHYELMAPPTLMCEWGGPEDVQRPNVQVIRQKRKLGANYTAIVFGALWASNDPYKQKYPVFDLGSSCLLDCKRANVAAVLKDIFRKMK